MVIYKRIGECGSFYVRSKEEAQTYILRVWFDKPKVAVGETTTFYAEIVNYRDTTVEKTYDLKVYDYYNNLIYSDTVRITIGPFTKKTEKIADFRFDYDGVYRACLDRHCSGVIVGTGVPPEKPPEQPPEERPPTPPEKVPEGEPSKLSLIFPLVALFGILAMSKLKG